MDFIMLQSVIIVYYLITFIIHKFTNFYYFGRNDVTYQLTTFDNGI